MCCCYWTFSQLTFSIAADKLGCQWVSLVSRSLWVCTWRRKKPGSLALFPAIVPRMGSMTPVFPRR